MSLDLALDGDGKSRKRALLNTPSSITRSAKRRRISVASADLLRELQDEEDPVTEAAADRFIPARPKNFLPLNITPRTNRIARVFGLSDERVFNFTEPLSATPDVKMLALLRNSASQLFRPPTSLHPTSAASNLGNRKQFLMALDGPGIPEDPFAFPLTWSETNCIAVACAGSVYYQNLNNRAIAHLCELERPQDGLVQCIEWGGKKRQNVLALGSTRGTIELWDAKPGERLRAWHHASGSVSGVSWQGDIVAVGRDNGTIALLDSRAKTEVRKVDGHKGKVYGMKWSHDGMYMASGDHNGGVYVWDSRASKSIIDASSRTPKMKHKGPVKALAWCPWKSGLLATGGVFPDGKIHIWSTNKSIVSYEPKKSNPTPLHTVSLNTSVTSLHWSPHCKELLSTHASSWVPPPSTSRQYSDQLVPVKTSLTNSMTVHSYPGLKRLVSVTAHAGPVVQSCLGPDGTMLFTVCPIEEAMKMWKVWGKREKVEKRDSVFDRCSIR